MRSKLLTFALCALALVFSAAPAAAQDMQPGDACGSYVAGDFMHSGGPELPGAGHMLVCDGVNWVSVLDYADSGRMLFQVNNDIGPCTAAKDGRIRYISSQSPPWEYCDGGATTCLPFKQPRCQDDDTGECYLQATRSNDDPEFTAANIASGVNILGVTGTLTGGCNIFTNFDFTDKTVAPITLTESEIIQIDANACAGSVSISGDGTPQFRTCTDGSSDANCDSTFVQNWATSGNLNDNEYLQLRLTSNAVGTVVHTATVTVGSVSDVWNVTTASCDTTPTIYTIAGLQSYTVPIACNSVTVELWAGGAGGDNGDLFSSGDGGGGGAYSKKTVSVTGGSSYNTYVGAGGGAGSNGEDSYFIDTSTVLAKGGLNNKTGGSAASGVGTTKFSGGNGSTGNIISAGGGGGGAGSAANGGNASGATGGTGGAPDGGNGGNALSSGQQLGGGGGGGAVGFGAGSTGAMGKAILTPQP